MYSKQIVVSRHSCKVLHVQVCRRLHLWFLWSPSVVRSPLWQTVPSLLCYLVNFGVIHFESILLWKAYKFGIVIYFYLIAFVFYLWNFILHPLYLGLQNYAIFFFFGPVLTPASHLSPITITWFFKNFTFTQQALPFICSLLISFGFSLLSSLAFPFPSCRGRNLSASHSFSK
jgi:hypothetical protein